MYLSNLPEWVDSVAALIPIKMYRIVFYRENLLKWEVSSKFYEMQTYQLNGGLTDSWFIL